MEISSDPCAKTDKVVRRRQNPVSCRHCRAKKLRCDRNRPCSNCTAREEECEYETNHATTSARIQHDIEPSNSAILSRLQRLEDMILRMNHGFPSSPDSIASRKADIDRVSTEMTPVEESHQIESQQLSSIGTQQPTLVRFS